MEKFKKAKQEAFSCPYLDTIQRYRLDFDFEKVCSLTLSPLNVYACLVCGKYFQGRGNSSKAYFHSIDEDHHVFLNLDTLRFYCLPDNYEVFDTSLEDIKVHVYSFQSYCSPSYSKEQLQDLGKSTCYDISGRKYIPGFVGINNIKANDYANVVLQSLGHCEKFRDFLLTDPDFKRPLRVKEFVRKMWNPCLFKCHISPHELMAVVSKESRKKFQSTVQSDALDFMQWLLNQLGRKCTIVDECFKGNIRVESNPVAEVADDPLAPQFSDVIIPFIVLGLDLPMTPLFQDQIEKNIIPQVAIQTLLEKYDWKTFTVFKGIDTRKRFAITKCPKYLILHIKRFSNNNWVLEKNPTIVNFPIGDLSVPYLQDNEIRYCQYDLVANICNIGSPGNEQAYKVHIHNESQWFEVQDLLVKETMPQTIFMSEAYIQIWEQRVQ